MFNNEPGAQSSGRQEWRMLALFWVVFTAIGEFLALGINLLPGQFAREAKVVDDAYVLLISLAVPVFALVSSTLLVAVLRFRVKVSGVPTQDGPGITGNERLVKGWLAVTALLAVGITINPGFIGLSDLRGSKRADLVIKVDAQRWSWRFQYENGAFTGKELVLPVDKRIRFDVTGLDIIHSFWIPAFRVKIDAVPGRTTRLYVTPNRIGGVSDDPTLRLQCAELCGQGHARMAVPVRVLSDAAFTKYTADLKAQADAAQSASPATPNAATPNAATPNSTNEGI